MCVFTPQQKPGLGYTDALFLLSLRACGVSLSPVPFIHSFVQGLLAVLALSYLDVFSNGQVEQERKNLEEQLYAVQQSSMVRNEGEALIA